MPQRKSTDHPPNPFRPPAFEDGDPGQAGHSPAAGEAPLRYRVPGLDGEERRDPDGAGAGMDSAPRSFTPGDFGAGEEGGGLGVEPPTALSPAEEARQEAERILERAGREAEKVWETARQEGFETGRKEGRQQLAEAADRLEQIARELAGYKTSLYEQARTQTVELAVAMVDKILGPLAQGDGEAVVRVVERAMQLLPDRETVTVRVHPEDLKTLLDAKQQILEDFDGIKKLTVLEDPSVKRGGCLVQTPSAEIDARLETQLQEVARAVRGP